MREGQAAAWVWVGKRVLLIRLRSVERLRMLKPVLKAG
jgi:hypothetical protein